MDTAHFSRSGQVYLSAVIAAGLAILAGSLLSVIGHGAGAGWLLLAALTAIGSSASVGLVAVPASISVADTFVFASILLYGPAAGALTAAIDGLVASCRTPSVRRQAHRLLFNVSAPAIAVWCASWIFYSVAGLPATGIGAAPLDRLLVPFAICAVSYFMLNSGLIVAAVSFEAGLHPGRIWRRDFAWLSLNPLCGASLALILLAYTRSIGASQVILVAPVIVVVYVTFRTVMGRVRDTNAHLLQVNRLHLSTVEALAMAIDAKDQVTHGHIRRVQAFAVGLARRLGVTDDGLIKAIEAAALLHDTGKLAIPEYILNKPGRLTPAEFERMKTHAGIGADILSSIDFPFPVVPIVRHHHEDWDGSGYPDGLRGTDIPLGARILSVVDCFDALTSDRPYRRALPEAEANRILVERRGRMYDPLVVDTFLRVQRELAVAVSVPAAPPAICLEPAATAIASGDDDPQVRAAEADEGASEAAASAVMALLGLAGAPEAPAADAGLLALAQLSRLAPADLLVLYAYDATGDVLVAGPALGLHAGDIAGLHMAPGERLSGWVGACRRTSVNSDPALDFAGTPAASAFGSCLSVPLVDGERLVGVVTLYAVRRQAYTAGHRRAVELAAHPAACAVARAARADSARAVDALTGLPPRAALDRLASSHAGLALPGPVAVLIIDVGVTEASGLVGPADDASMAQAAALTRAALRPGDLLFRWEGDRLAAVLAQTRPDEARALADHLAARLTGAVATPYAAPLPVTTAVFASSRDGTGLVDLLARAAVADPFPFGMNSVDFVAAVS